MGQGDANAERARGDAGAGLIGLMASVFVFLVFLLLATHLLVGLYARSVVAGAAFDAAQHVARNAGGTGEAGALQIVRGEVGTTLVNAGVTARDADHIEYTVIVSAPRLLATAWLPGSSDTITRTARVRIERMR